MNTVAAFALAAVLSVGLRSAVAVNYAVFARYTLQIRPLAFHRVAYDMAELCFTLVSIISLTLALADIRRPVTAWVAFVSVLLSAMYLLFRLTGEAGNKEI